MELSAEDNLRLNVLLHQNLQAVRIDESKMIVYALTDKGEAKVPLNPNCKDDKYIKNVKALFSTHVMGSPGGYPVYLKRWTRMGQARDESLSQLLLLGETEAVVAAVHAPGLTDELAARAWWAMPNSQNARKMLEKQAVVEGETGKVLAEFLLEFLPFEEDQIDMIESVRLVLQPGLIDEEDKQKLWAKAKSKRSLYVGFLHSAPDDLPLDAAPNPVLDSVASDLQQMSEQGNACAAQLLRVLSEKGQAFVATAELALKKPMDQHVVESLLNAIAAYFTSVKPEQFAVGDMEAICEQCADYCATQCHGAAEVIEKLPQLKPYVEAMVILSCLSVELVNPIFARTDAIGTVMRKKIKPITDPVFEQLKVLKS